MKKMFILLVTSPGGTHAEGAFDTMNDLDAFVVKKWAWVTHERLARERYQVLKNINMGASITSCEHHQSRADKIKKLF